MSDDIDLARLATAHGIFERYLDMQGRMQRATPETLRSLLAANDIAAESAGAVRDSLAALAARKKARRFPMETIVESRRKARLAIHGSATWQLHCDETGRLLADGRATDVVNLPAVASGTYALDLTRSGRRETTRVIAAPARAPGLQGGAGATRIWGMNLALYGLKSSRNAGMGDYADLAEFSRASGEAGADFIGINPVHAMGHSFPSSSPYSPSHRGFLNTRHIALDAIPGLESSLAARQARARAKPELGSLRATQHVDLESHNSVHQRLLSALYNAFRADAPDQARLDFEEFCAESGDDLAQFARFETAAALCPADLHCSAPVDRSLPNGACEVFHSWLQWVADRQLARAQQTALKAGMSLGLYMDFAVGARRDGAEGFCERRVIAKNVSVGAPPDHLNPDGQNWNLTAYAPRKLAGQCYRPFRRLLAATMRHAGVVRIDHAPGLSRSYWIPDDGTPGGYVGQPFEALLAIIKIEAEKSGTTVVGEDLGLVPRGFRKSLRDNGIYGCSVMQYERDETNRLNPGNCSSSRVLASFSTHDTPTIRGFESCRDIHWWQKLGWIGEAASAHARKKRKEDVRQLVGERPSADFTNTVHALLSSSPAEMVTAQLDDILDHEDAQNLPGTTTEHLNWRRKYHVAVEKIPEDARFREIGGLMNETRGKNMPSSIEEKSNGC